MTSKPLPSGAHAQFSPAARGAEPTNKSTPVGKVVHLVGVLSDDVLSFLLPATGALADAGIEQSIVFVDGPGSSGVLPRLHASVRVVQAPRTRNPLRRRLWALRAYRRELLSGPTQGVHLYGLWPRLLGTWFARRAGIAIALHHSTYKPNSQARSGGFDALLHGISPPDTASAHSGAHAIDQVDRPVDPAFFLVPRNEVRRPLIVTGSHISNPRSAELFAQLAVLLSEEDLGLSFNWMGAVNHESRLRLKAAQVGLFPAETVDAWASRLAAGWVYLAPGGDSGFPSLLVEAMAVGLPCVAVDTPEHRDVIRHGETGYLCRTAEEIIHCIAPLIDSQELRQSIGQAARRSVAQRFAEADFREALLAAYQLPTQQAGVASVPALNT